MEIETDKSAMGKLLRVEHRFFERPDGEKGEPTFQLTPETKMTVPMTEFVGVPAFDKSYKDFEKFAAEQMKDQPDYIINIIVILNRDEVGMFVSYDAPEFVGWVDALNTMHLLTRTRRKVLPTGCNLGKIK